MTEQSKTITPPVLLKPSEVAEALRISPRKLWGLTASGEIPSLKIGRSVRYDPHDLAHWIETAKEGPR